MRQGYGINLFALQQNKVTLRHIEYSVNNLINFKVGCLEVSFYFLLLN